MTAIVVQRVKLAARTIVTHAKISIVKDMSKGASNMRKKEKRKREK